MFQCKEIINKLKAVDFILIFD